MASLPLGDIPLDKFLSDYWQSTPLYIQNALADIIPLITADELAGLACEELVESRLILQHGDNWELKHGPLSEEIFSTLPKSQWTLLVQAVDHWLPSATKFLEQFNFIPRWRIDDLMISYATEKGGVGPHFDNYDVFLVQVQGRRQWHIGGKFNEQSSQREDLPVMILNDFKAKEIYECHPGDILYVPPGYGHNGISLDSDCMTYSIGFRAPSHSEILREYTDYLGDQLSESLRYEDSDLFAQTSTGEINSQTIDKLQNILRQYADDKVAIADWFGRYITSPKYQYDGDTEADFSPAQLCDVLEKKCVVVRNESSRFAFETRNDKNYIFVDGNFIETTDESDALVEMLCNQLEIKSENIENTKGNLNLLCILLRQGALYIPK